MSDTCTAPLGFMLLWYAMMTGFFCATFITRDYWMKHNRYYRGTSEKQHRIIMRVLRGMVIVMVCFVTVMQYRCPSN